MFCVLYAFFGASVPPIEQVPLNSAPGSTIRVFVSTSPWILPLVRNDNCWWHLILPSSKPKISAFWQSIDPLTRPASPITTLPLQFKSPSIIPSIRKSLSAVIVPTILLPAVNALNIKPLCCFSFAILFLIFNVFHKISVQRYENCFIYASAHVYFLKKNAFWAKKSKTFTFHLSPFNYYSYLCMLFCAQI